MKFLVAAWIASAPPGYGRCQRRTRMNDRQGQRGRRGLALSTTGSIEAALGSGWVVTRRARHGVLARLPGIEWRPSPLDRLRDLMALIVAFVAALPALVAFAPAPLPDPPVVEDESDPSVLARCCVAAHGPPTV